MIITIHFCRCVFMRNTGTPYTSHKIPCVVASGYSTLDIFSLWAFIIDSSEHV